MKMRPLENPIRYDLFGYSPLQQALADFANSGDAERGAIYTKSEVVEFILDLVGYSPTQVLADYSLLEPSFGRGDFLLAAIDRLLKSVKTHSAQLTAALLMPAIRAVELNAQVFESTKQTVIDKLVVAGLPRHDAISVADHWLVLGDFLLVPLPAHFDFVVGNPPYIRQESVPQILMDEYRQRYATIFDRADIYVPFFERGLDLLSANGRLGFICADRWMKNRYGGPLREKIASEFHVSIYVDMVKTAAFHSDVVAYPAITVMGRGKSSTTSISRQPEISSKSLSKLAKQLTSPKPSHEVQHIDGVAQGSRPWIFDLSNRTKLLRRLEETFPLLETVGCKVGIGVATGADKAFIGKFHDLDVEDDRKIPLVMTKDIQSGKVDWCGRGVINPFADDGTLVKLSEYPRLAAHLDANKELILGRHVAKKSKDRWYRTIDRIYPELVSRPKLLIPDIKGEPLIVFEEGKFYPHHNLYFVTSDDWDLQALQAVLMSDITRLFIAAYSTKMRGGFLRFQAQYLRRLRLPEWNDVMPALRQRLKKAAKQGNLDACNQATFELYDLSESEIALFSDGVWN